MKKNIYRVLILFLMFIFAFLSVAVSANTAGYVTDGLVAFYDGSDNLNGSHDKQSTIWKDSSGNGNHIQNIPVNNGINRWSDTAYHLDSSMVAFPDAIKEALEDDEFTIEVVLDNFDPKESNYNTIIVSDDEKLHLFRTKSTNIIEFKSPGNTRPKTPEGTSLDDLSSQVTITIRFKVGVKAEVYINGILKGTSKSTINASEESLGKIYFGNGSTASRFAAMDFKCIRFYSRALTVAEITQNYNKDIGVNPTTGDSTIASFYMIGIMVLAVTLFKGSFIKRKFF